MGWIELDGAVNVRDVGGLPTQDGGRVAPGRLLRADNLQGLTAPDVRRLVDDLGVRTVVDLRTAAEVELEGPGPMTREPAVTHRHCSLHPESGGMTDVDADAAPPAPPSAGIDEDALASPGLGNDMLLGYYLGYLRDRPDSIVTALRAVAEDSGGAAILHCAAGKDRTGTVVALALAVAGVTREAIVEDYVATGEVLEAILDRLRSSSTYAADLDGLPADVHRPRRATMEGLLDAVERQGGAAAWLERAGLEPDALAALRARLVA